MRTVTSWVLVSVLLLAGCAATSRQSGPPLHELAPAGKVRVGVGVGAVSSAFWATRDPATGQPRGVTVDLANALARKLGRPLELVVYPNSGELTAAGPRNEWDVAFMPVDEERAKIVDFGPAYYLFESTYLVPSGSAMRAVADVDRAGVRVAAVANTTTSRSARRALKTAALVEFRTVEEIVDRVLAGQVDAVALGRESLESLRPRLPGSRILDGHFHASGVAVAVPKNRPASLAYVSAFIEEAKATGVVRRALDGAGLTNAAVAPPAAAR
jgi:polar amino acid transport system substrate-binding protein